MAFGEISNSETDKPFCHNATESFTIPSRYYLDPDIYRQEITRIFYKSWWYAGHVSQLANPGDRILTRIDDQSVFITRGNDTKLRAFYNVCQHRGHELVSESGNSNIIVCPYHAWSYDLTGKLQSARNTDKVHGFNKCEFSLKAVRVEVFCGMVFINLDENAAPLAELAAELESEIRQYCPAVDSLSFVRRDDFAIRCNWKVMVDNFLECYHCQPAHRDFVDLVDMNLYRSKVKGIYSSHISGSARTRDNSAFKFKPGEVDFGFAGWYLWPNLTIWIYPGDANMSVLQMLPHGAENTIEYQDWFVPEAQTTEQLREAMDYQRDVLQPEDIALCESVQRGLKSRGYNQGRFVVDAERSEMSEHAVHHFQSMLISALDELG